MALKKCVVPFAGTAEQEKALKATIAEHISDKGALMPVLQKAQEIYGYLPIEVQTMIAEEMGIPLEKVYGVATFYAQFSLNPKGKYRISVCLGTACYVKGAGDVYSALQRILGIGPGEITADGAQIGIGGGYQYFTLLQGNAQGIGGGNDLIKKHLAVFVARNCCDQVATQIKLHRAVGSERLGFVFCLIAIFVVVKLYCPVNRLGNDDIAVFIHRTGKEGNTGSNAACIVIGQDGILAVGEYIAVMQFNLHQM